MDSVVESCSKPGFPFAIESLLQTLEKDRINDPVMYSPSTKRLSNSWFNPLTVYHGVIVVGRESPYKGLINKGNSSKTNSTRNR
jgi:hypothetical protein